MNEMNPRAANLLTVCVDSVDSHEIRGRIYHLYSTQPDLFVGASSMLLKMEALYDRIGFPQAAYQARTFQQRQGGDTDLDRNEVQLMSAKDVMSQKGVKGTFVVQVQYRQNATWQGNVVWAEKNITRSFRSALELLKLIDSSLDEEEQKD